MSEITASAVELLARARTRAQTLLERAEQANGDADHTAELRALCAELDTATQQLAAETAAQTMVDFDGDAAHTATAFAIPALTAREGQVLELVALGRSNKEIAAELSITERTAGFHVGNVLAKLGADGRVEAVRIALRAGMLLEISN